MNEIRSFVNPIKTAMTRICAVLVPLLAISCAHMENQNTALAEDGGSQNTMLFFYREHLNHLNGVRSGACPMYPSCSEYSRQAIQKHGAAMGWMMTIDRLMRCGRDELKTARQIYVNGTKRYYDPVENNDFWHALK